MRWLPLVLLLAGCKTIEYRDRIIYQPVEVPVPVTCVTEMPGKVTLENPGNTDYDKIRAIIIDRQNLITQQDRLLAILTGCKS